jgi:hypothetical protein
LSRDAICFWDLSLKCGILDPRRFSPRVVSEPFLVLGVTSTNDKVVLYDFDTCQRLSAEVSARGD